MSRFVRPETVRLFISDGDWLDVKRQLNAGEQREVFNRMTRNGMTVNERGIDGTMEIDPMQAGVSTVLAYLLDWSFVDDNGVKVDIAGKPIETVASALDALDLDTYQEIVRSIQAHENTANERRLIEKKRRSDAARLLATS